MGQGRGGSRPGAGRPTGGVKQVNRLLVDAIDKGLAMAAEARGLPGETDEELAASAAAQIAAEMVLAGRGDEVLKLRVLAMPKNAGAAGDPKEGETWLTRALGQLPGTKTPPGDRAPIAAPIDTVRDEPRAPNSQSEAPEFTPVFLPQIPLLAPGPGTPHPPSAAPASTVPVQTDRFEKNRSEKSEAVS